MTPKRIQRKRTAGWKQPPNTRYCGRGTKYGNTHVIKKMPIYWMVEIAPNHPSVRVTHTLKEAHQVARDFYAEDMKRILEKAPNFYDDLRKYTHLSCFCPLDMPCHLDPIIEYLEAQ